MSMERILLAGGWTRSDVALVKARQSGSVMSENTAMMLAQTMGVPLTAYELRAIEIEEPKFEGNRKARRAALSRKSKGSKS